MRYNLIGNTQRLSSPINSVRNLQRKFNRQHRRIAMHEVWSQVFGAKKDES
jgi:hypothetical protein